MTRRDTTLQMQIEKELRNRLRVHVRTRRNALGKTLKSTSEAVDMHWRHLQKIEAGQVNITLATLVKLANVLDVDPKELLMALPSSPALHTTAPATPPEPPPPADAPSIAAAASSDAPSPTPPLV